MYSNNFDHRRLCSASYISERFFFQTKLRDMQDSWLRKKTEEIQSFADRKDMKKFHDALKTIYGPKSYGATTLLSADGNTLLTDKEAILERWAEHFNSVLNRPSSINQDAIDRLPQIECNVLLDEFLSYRYGNKKSSSTTIIWQSPWCRCNSCRSLQGWGGGGGYPWQRN